jgi:Acetyltransferase (GNAT) family
VIEYRHIFQASELQLVRRPEIILSRVIIVKNMPSRSYTECRTRDTNRHPAFLSSLGANLRISDDALLPSPISTPASLRPTYSSDYTDPLAPPSPLFTGMSSDDTAAIEPIHISSAAATSAPAIADDVPANPLADVPSLSTFHATSLDDRRDALKLVADSVAQQRQVASQSIIFHPLTMGLYVLIAAVIAKFMVKTTSDWPLMLTTMAGVTMACLVAVRLIAAPYLNKAEEIGKWEWLGDDTVVCTKFGDTIIGALVLGWEGNEKKNARKKGKGGRGVIRAWTIKMRYRGKGEGKMLLEEAAKVVQQKGGDGLVFAEDHACKFVLFYTLIPTNILCRF